jgi:hypothetical protein
MLIAPPAMCFASFLIQLIRAAAADWTTCSSRLPVGYTLNNLSDKPRDDHDQPYVLELRSRF